MFSIFSYNLLLKIPNSLFSLFTLLSTQLSNSIWKPQEITIISTNLSEKLSENSATFVLLNNFLCQRVIFDKLVRKVQSKNLGINLVPFNCVKNVFLSLTLNHHVLISFSQNRKTGNKHIFKGKNLKETLQPAADHRIHLLHNKLLRFSSYRKEAKEGGEEKSSFKNDKNVIFNRKQWQEDKM